MNIELLRTVFCVANIILLLLNKLFMLFRNLITPIITTPLNLDLYIKTLHSDTFLKVLCLISFSIFSDYFSCY